MFPPEIFFYIFTLMVIVIGSDDIIDFDVPGEHIDQGSYYTIDSNASGENIQKDKPSEFNCIGIDMTTLWSSLVSTVWPSQLPEDKNITLHLLTRNSTKTLIVNEKNQIYGKKLVELVKYYRSHKKTVIIVHGFLGSVRSSWMIEMAWAYLAYEDVNVIMVDWSRMSKVANYEVAAGGTLSAGTQIADLLGQLYNVRTSTDEVGPIHMIGFSLGAHVVGIAADRFNKKKLSWQILRITGLDPAFPCFTANEAALDKDDAPLVDIIHTNGNREMKMGFGVPHAMGDIDFWVNGGELQPSCSTVMSYMWDYVSEVLGDAARAACSHKKAPKYFIQTLKDAASKNSKKLWGPQWDYTYFQAINLVGLEGCDKDPNQKHICATMGIEAQFSAPGAYLVVTAAHNPYNNVKLSDRLAALKEIRRIFKRND